MIEDKVLIIDMKKSKARHSWKNLSKERKLCTMHSRRNWGHQEIGQEIAGLYRNEKLREGKPMAWRILE